MRGRSVARSAIRRRAPEVGGAMLPRFRGHAGSTPEDHPPMADLEAFRSELRRWLEANAPQAVRGYVLSSEGDGNWGGRRATYEMPEMKQWLDVMASRGFTAPTWPKEYGG